MEFQQVFCQFTRISMNRLNVSSVLQNFNGFASKAEQSKAVSCTQRNRFWILLSLAELFPKIKLVLKKKKLFWNFFFSAISKKRNTSEIFSGPLDISYRTICSPPPPPLKKCRPDFLVQIVEKRSEMNEKRKQIIPIFFSSYGEN